MTLGRLGHPGLTGFQACQLLGVAEALLGIVRLRLTNVPALTLTEVLQFGPKGQL